MNESIMNAQPGPDHLAFLKKHFGHSQFRPMQWKIINTILNDKNDQCIVMATGYGKSLCYQYPAVYLNGITIVISPLISLMQDQVLLLAMMNISACLLGPAQTEMRDTIDRVLNNEYRLIYLTPEFCMGDYGQDVLKKIKLKNKIVLVAIDEAHCVSQWGLDFRPKYRKLGTLKNLFPDVPFLTVTASATRPVCNDICSSLNLKNPEIIFTDFDRPNLFLAVWMKGKDPFDDMRRFMVRDGLRLKFPGPTIIYCPTRKSSEVVATSLTDNGLPCYFYHAQMKLELREEVHENFTKDIISVISATSAFGMGIDKPDVRLIIHYGAPKEIESYYQEIGRAGRDGLPAACHIFYSSGDFAINAFFTNHLQGKIKEHRDAMSRLMEKYLETQECRRQVLLSYFDDAYSAKETPQANCCDNCNKSIKNNGSKTDNLQLDLSNDAVMVMKVIKLFKGRSGLNAAVLFLRGSRSKKLSPGIENHELFGTGRFKSEAWWKAIGRLLIREELLKQQSCNAFLQKRGFNNFVSCIGVTELGESYIRNPEVRKKIKLIPTNEIIKMSMEVQRKSPIKKKEPPSKLIDFTFSQRCLPKIITGVQNEASCSSTLITDDIDDNNEEGIDNEETALQGELYFALMELRSKLAVKYGCMPYMIANNQLLLDLAKDRPHNFEELKKVEGLGEVKAGKFGNELLKAIKTTEEALKNRPNKIHNDELDDEETEKLVKDNPFEETLQRKASEVYVGHDVSNVSDCDVWGDVDDSFLIDLADEEISKHDKTEMKDFKCVPNENYCTNKSLSKSVCHSESSHELDTVEKEKYVWPDVTIMNDVKSSVSCETSKSPLIGEERKISTILKSSSTLLAKKRAIKFVDSDEDDQDCSNSHQKKKLPDWMEKRKSTIIPKDKDKRLKTNSLFK